MGTLASIRRAQPLLGTFVEIAASGPVRPDLQKAVDAAFAAVAHIHRLMSFHAPDSDVSRINDAQVGQQVGVDPHTFRVLRFARQVSELSGGAFDITVAPSLVENGFLPRRPLESVPIEAAYPALDLLAGDRTRWRRKGWIDLGGIAKGYAVDCAIAALRTHGLTTAIVNAGGDLATFGESAEMIHIRDPRSPGISLCQVAVANAALASSARLFRPMDSGDTFVSSTINPATREPAAEIAGATVRAPSCTVADALTKVVMIRGEHAAGILKTYQASALLVSAAGDVCVTPEWQDVVRTAA